MSQTWDIDLIIPASTTPAADIPRIVDGFNALRSLFSGATEPTDMTAYMFWADTTTGLLKIRNAANSAWVTIGTLASTNLGLLSLAGGNLTGGINDVKTTVASATTPDIFATTVGNVVDYTGTTTCTGFATAPQAGASRILICAAAAVFTAGANLLIAGVSSGQNFTAAAGDWLQVVAITTTQFRIVALKADGTVVAESGRSTWDLSNLTLVASVAGNALTVAVKTKAGTDPSSTDSIPLTFRNATPGTGDYATISLTGALSLVASSGSTLGTVSGVPHRLYVGVANDGGTIRLFLYNPLTSGLDLFRLDEGQVYSSTAEGGAGAADSAQVLYSGTAFTAKAIRLLGYVESTQATAGTWVTTPSKIQIMGPGVARTGDVVQRQYVADGAYATGTTAMPNDNTTPQNTEGDQYLSLAITPTSTINLLQHDIVAYTSSGANSRGIIALFQDSTADALATAVGYNASAALCTGVLRHRMRAGTTSATTFKVRIGAVGGAALYFNGEGGALFNGTLASQQAIEEVMV